MKTRVVHCQREKYDVYIGRPGKWGNPFRVDAGRSRETVIALYAGWIVRQPNLMAALHELDGKALGCWCKPGPCHGDILAELVNRMPRCEGCGALKRAPSEEAMRACSPCSNCGFNDCGG